MVLDDIQSLTKQLFEINLQNCLLVQMITVNRAYELSWQLTLDLRESSVKTTRLRYIFGPRQNSIFAANFPACIGSSFILKAAGD